MREYSLLLRDECVFVCLDDKHRVKVGKFNYCVAFDFNHFSQQGSPTAQWLLQREAEEYLFELKSVLLWQITTLLNLDWCLHAS